ncbi:FHA domain protein [Caballeronia arationis]|uniref:FHA domain-containing protein n=2 Tax=Caballeronia arationis TaxID=1777142 RepID=A0A7Z7N1A3_9BURK|nr:FHA domain protein [Caballeronia arationis]SOE59387.1 FHA domain-containing protein [Caballeronia arationis]
MAEVHASVGEAFDVVLKPVSHPELAEIRIDENLFAIGRAEAPFDSCAPEAVAQLSRRHARIFIEHGAVYIADLDSKNGTSVNGAEVRQKPALLHNGDTISFGSKLSYRVQFVPRAKNRASVARTVTVTLAPERDDLGLQPIDITQYPFLISKADDLFARHRAQYPHQVNYVSRRHAHVFLKNDTPFVEDLGSTNGTFVNGKRLEAAAVPLEKGDVLAFGGTHFVYRVSVRREPEGDSTLTQVREAVDPEAADSDKTTFVGSAHSFLDIFCIDQPLAAEDEVNEEALPEAADAKKDGERRRDRSRFTMLFSALRIAFTGNERLTSKRGLAIGAALIAALVAIGLTIYFSGSSERRVKGLMASGQYEEAANVANDYLQRHPDDTRFTALDTEAVLKAKVPEWLAALKSKQFDKANAIIGEMNRLGANNADVRPLVNELEWIGKLESFVVGRGGPDAPIRMYADEDRIGEILRHWEDDASVHQRSLDRIASYVPAFATPYAEALSHLRKLQSDDSVYLAAIDRLKASIAKELSQDHAEALQGVLSEYADKYPRLGGLDRVRADLGNYLDLQTQMRGTSLAPVVAMMGKVKFDTPPFQERYAQLSANRLPSQDVLSRYESVRDAWRSGQSAQAIDGLQKMPAGPWSEVIATELAHKKAVAAQFADVQKARGTKAYEDALLSFYGTLDPQQDAFYVKSVDPDVAAFRDKAIARAQDLLNRAQTQWTQYRANGSIGGTQRLEAGISDTFRTQARLLAGAQSDAQGGMRIFRQVKADGAAKWQKMADEIDAEAQLQRRSLQELRMVLEPGLLKDKLALIGGAGSEERRTP